MKLRHLLLVLLALTAPAVAEAQGTLAPWVSIQFFDNNGDPCSGCKLYTYAAGTSTNQATYTTVTLTVGTENANPVVMDAAGRPTTGYIYLSATSYRFVLKDSTAATTYFEADNTPAIPATGVGLDVTTQTAGEALSAGDVAYLSDGSGGTTAGRWYRADADFTYASSLASIIGMVPTAITSGATGTIRIGGRVTGLTGLTAGTDYYISATTGATTATAPTNARFVGRAESTTVMTIEPNPTIASILARAVRINAATPYTLTFPTADAAGSLKSNGSGTLTFSNPAVLSKAATYAVLTTDGDDVLINSDATTGALTLNLYTAVGNTGKRITVKKTDSSANLVIVDPSGTETVDGVTVAYLSSQNQVLQIESDGTNWKTVTRIAPSFLGAEGRCTLSTGVAVTTADVTGAASIFYTPYIGSRIALYDGTGSWNVRTFTEKTLAIGTITSGKNYDVFAYDNAGVVALELSAAWTSDTARADALTTQDGILVKSGTITRRYVCTFRTTATTTTEDSARRRFLWNMYNRRPTTMFRQDPADNWTYTTATWRQANGGATNQLEVVTGQLEDAIDITVSSVQSNSNIANSRAIGIGIGSTTTVSLLGTTGVFVNAATYDTQIIARLVTAPALGYSFYTWLEWSTANGTTTWYGDDGLGTAPGRYSAMFGIWQR